MMIHIRHRVVPFFAMHGCQCQRKAKVGLAHNQRRCASICDQFQPQLQYRVGSSFGTARTLR